MGTYTTNKNLFMPTVGEQGWGELVNNNFSTIDNFLKPITVSGSTYTFTGNLTGNVMGDVTGNLTGNVTGDVNGFLFIKGTIGSSGDVVYATGNTATYSPSGNGLSFTVPGCTVTFGNPHKVSHGIYCRRSDLTDTSSSVTRKIRFNNTNEDAVLAFVYNIDNGGNQTSDSVGAGRYYEITAKVGSIINILYAINESYGGYNRKYTASVVAGNCLYVKYATL